MATDNNNVKEAENDLFVKYSDAINEAYRRAVREALKKHKLAGNPVVVERDGKMVILRPDEIGID